MNGAIDQQMVNIITQNSSGEQKTQLTETVIFSTKLLGRINEGNHGNIL